MYTSKFTGQLPTEFGRLVKLQSGFDLYTNQVKLLLFGPDSSSRKQTEALTSTHPHGTLQFTGTLPSQLGNLENMAAYLYLHSNQVEGTGK